MSESAKQAARLKYEIYSIAEALASEKPLHADQSNLIQNILSDIYRNGCYEIPKVRGRPAKNGFHEDQCLAYQFYLLEEKSDLDQEDLFHVFAKNNAMSWQDVRAKYFNNIKFVREVMDSPVWQEYLTLKEYIV